MSHAATPVLPTVGFRDPSTFRRIVVAAGSALNIDEMVEELSAITRDTLHEQYDSIVRRPAWLRTQLENAGETDVLRMLKANADFVGPTAFIVDRFQIPRSTLHREKDAGRVIAYRPAADDEFVYPFEQFSQNGAQPWAAEIVKAVGNGSAAIHFLYVPRKSLDDESFAEAMRDPRGRNVPALIAKALAKLTAE